MLLRVLLEGVGLGVILMLVCAVGIRNGAVGMVHLYHADVQERCVALGLTGKTSCASRPCACPSTSPTC